jgi:hypothetical protein
MMSTRVQTWEFKGGYKKRYMGRRAVQRSASTELLH